MATQVATAPGRTLSCFFLGVAVLYGLVALAGTWKPELGLDLQGGTRITLTAKGTRPTRQPRGGAPDHRPARQRLRASPRPRSRRSAASTSSSRSPAPPRTAVRSKSWSGVRPSCGSGWSPASRVPGPVRHRRPAARARRRRARRGRDRRSPATRRATRTTRPTPRARPTRPAPTDDHGPPATRAAGRRRADGEYARPRTRSPGRPHRTRRSVALLDRLQLPTDTGAAVDDHTPGRDRRPRRRRTTRTSRWSPASSARTAQSRSTCLSRSVIEGTELDDASAGIPQGEVEWAVNLDASTARRTRRSSAEAISRPLTARRHRSASSRSCSTATSSRRR